MSQETCVLTKQRHTIFKSVHCLSDKEMEDEKQAVRDFLIDTGQIEDREYPDDEVLRPGCSHCRKTYIGLINDELNFNEQCNYEAEVANLNKQLQGTLYAIVDVGRWNGRYRAYKRLTKRAKFPESGNSYPIDNLNSILDYFKCDYIDVWFEDGEIKSETIHHDSSHHITFREFFPEGLPKDDPRYEEYGCSIEPVDFERMLQEAASVDEWLAAIDQYTKPVGHYVADIYGWN